MAAAVIQENFEIKVFKEILLFINFLLVILAQFTENEILRFLELLAILVFLMIRFTLKYQVRASDQEKLKKELKV